jgi:hypothetical protein
MDSRGNEKDQLVTTARVIRFLIGVVVFGALMGLRPEFQSLWTRSLVAAVAAAVLALCILPLRRQKQ